VIRSYSVRPIALLVSLTVLLTGCAGERDLSRAASPPEVRLGPVLELLPLETSVDQVDALVDDRGQAHVVIAAKDREEVHHVVVSPDGVVQRELVESGSSPSAVSAAIGGDGRLHLLLDGRHLVREDSAWTAATPPPWEAVGIEVANPELVQGKAGLLWTFSVSGKEVGAKGRWEWYAFGGYPAGIVLPWYSSSQKQVIVPEAAVADPLWYVLDPQDNLDTSDTMPAVDDQGNLHVVYDAFRGGIATTYEPRYARIALIPNLPPADQPAVHDPTRAKSLVPISGGRIPWFGPERRGLLQASAAVDPASSMVLIVRAHDASFALEEGQWSYPVALPLSRFWEPKLAPAGGNAFHLMTTAEDRVLYLFYSAGSWSAPVEVGQADVASGMFGGSIWGALDIASHAGRRAFVVWPTPAGIVGRWVDGPVAHEAPRDQVAEGGKPGTASIPENLQDFARGRAELVTPGVVTGFSEAIAAGTSAVLTRDLHDTSQWPALATVVLEDDYGDNLRWYYLGRAAEGMALCDAAERYYRRSRELSVSFWTRCFSIACYGFKIPEILDERLAAVEAMRAAGRCVEAP
jgi:hypothetical protein